VRRFRFHVFPAAHVLLHLPKNQLPKARVSSGSDPDPSASCPQYLLKLPADPGVLLPGLWMLFVIDAAGVPSVSKDIRIKSECKPF